MNTTKFLVGTLVGGVVFFVLGFVVYVLLLESFFMAHAGSATGVQKTEFQYWPLMLGNLAHAALLSYIFLKWAGIKTLGAGFSAGLLIGFLVSLGFDMIMYDTSNLMDMTGAIGDVVAYSLISGVAGGVIGWVIGMGKSE